MGKMIKKILTCLNSVFGDGVLIRQRENKNTISEGFKAQAINDNLLEIHGTKALYMEEFKKNKTIVRESIDKSEELTVSNMAVFKSW